MDAEAIITEILPNTETYEDRHHMSNLLPLKDFMEKLKRIAKEEKEKTTKFDEFIENFEARMIIRNFSTGDIISGKVTDKELFRKIYWDNK